MSERRKLIALWIFVSRFLNFTGFSNSHLRALNKIRISEFFELLKFALSPFSAYYPQFCENAPFYKSFDRICLSLLTVSECMSV